MFNTRNSLDVGDDCSQGSTLFLPMSTNPKRLSIRKVLLRGSDRRHFCEWKG